MTTASGKAWTDVNTTVPLELQRASHANARAHIVKAPGHITAADVKRQIEKQDGRCGWCHRDLGQWWHVDWRKDLERGGTNTPDNLIIAGSCCLRHRGNYLPETEE